jgi:uncharacterized protein YacL
MAHTNRVRVVLGGLLAGVIINLVEYITNGVILRDAWVRAMQALGKPAAFSAGAIVMFNVWGFLLGIAAVWLYAAIRPRYGQGPATAIRAGVVSWVMAVFLANLSNYPMGLFPARLLVITSIVALIEIVLGTLAGAWVYKEEAAQPTVIQRAAA